jgi:hypothetical protein
MLNILRLPPEAYQAEADARIQCVSATKELVDLAAGSVERVSLALERARGESDRRTPFHQRDRLLQPLLHSFFTGGENWHAGAVTSSDVECRMRPIGLHPRPWVNSAEGS